MRLRVRERPGRRHRTWWRRCNRGRRRGEMPWWETWSACTGHSHQTSTRWGPLERRQGGGKTLRRSWPAQWPSMVTLFAENRLELASGGDRASLSESRGGEFLCADCGGDFPTPRGLKCHRGKAHDVRRLAARTTTHHTPRTTTHHAPRTTTHHRTTAPPHHRTTAPPHHRTTAPPQGHWHIWRRARGAAERPCSVARWWSSRRGSSERRTTSWYDNEDKPSSRVLTLT